MTYKMFSLRLLHILNDFVTIYFEFGHMTRSNFKKEKFEGRIFRKQGRSSNLNRGKYIFALGVDKIGQLGGVPSLILFLLPVYCELVAFLNM